MIRRAVLILAIGSASCLGPRSDASTFYVLSATATPAPAGSSMAVILGLGPVTLPGYLDRSEVVTRLSANQLSVSQVERWAQPLDESVVRALEMNLNRLVRPDGIVGYPWYASEGVVYGVEIDFTRLEADSTGRVTIAADWAVMNGDREETLYRDQSTLSEPANGPTAEAAVAAMSRALAQLSEQIAANLRRVHSGAGGR